MSVASVTNIEKKPMKISKNLIALIVTVVGSVSLGVQLQADQAFMFFYRESQQLLFLDWSYLSEVLLQFGGVGIFLSHFLVQFFIHPVVGALTTAALVGGTVWMMWLALRKINDNVALLPVVLVPLLVQIIYLATSYHHYEGLVALFFLAVALWGYSLCRECDYRVRLGVGAAIALVLYLLIGSIGVLFAVCALLFDAMLKREKWYLGLLYAAVVCIAGSFLVQRGEIIDYEFAYTPKFYYEFYVVMTPFLRMAWIATIAVMVIFYLVGLIKQLRPWMNGALLAVLCFVVAGWYLPRHEKEVNGGVYTYMELYHYLTTENWDGILSVEKLNFQDPLNANFVNFALSKKGELLDKMFLYPQVNASSLLNERFGTFVEEHCVYSEIYYHLGIVSQTLELSLAAMAGTYPGTPLLLQQFVRSRIVMGDYDLAGKFVYRLSKTYGYKKWAEEQQKFLHNDAAVEADAEYGLKRRTLPELSSEFVSMNGMFYDFMKALTANPDNETAREYAIACLLLRKDFDMIRSFVEEYYSTPVLPTLPVRLQEAVVTYSERDMDYCRRYGVSEQTISRFASFRQKILNLRHRQPNANPKSQLGEFRDTFWYYMLG